jgi:hypothetical protein
MDFEMTFERKCRTKFAVSQLSGPRSNRDHIGKVKRIGVARNSAKLEDRLPPGDSDSRSRHIA